MIFEQIKQPSLADRVEEKIREAIIESKLQPGDKLPSEIEFSEKLGVSRNIVREALTRLRMFGVVESRKRRGLILKEPEIFKGLDSIIDLPVVSDKTKHELFQLRVISELGMTSVVAARVTDEDLAELEAIVTREEEHPNDPEINLESDVAFHTKLFEIADNKIMHELHSLLRPFVSAHKHRFIPERFKREGVPNHRDLLEALKTRDPQRFYNEMFRHLGAFLHPEKN